ncbi:MAG TPA: ABC-F family ATP-binding cassette domain-containing protein [Candidatus Omnitrophota bacterium]|nr:ABC-F family ATP-binding cassette domain-containing protein [Candidatus Omnitrophota bacterium]
MPVLQLNHICRSYGPSVILDDVCATFTGEHKLGFIGRNGSGKSTLCKIITETEEMDSGNIVRSADLRLSYLAQHDLYRLDETGMEFLMRETGMEEWKCGEVAGKFRLKPDALGAKIEALPGGYRTRLKLVSMLLKEPNFLVLDEPTNYLDLATLILLENFLGSFDGGYIIVSHDREFLKRTCEQTMEIERGRLTLYPGGVEEYFAFKEEQLRHKMAYNKEIERRKEELQGFIDRFKAKAATASRAKSKIKQLERLKTIEIDHPMSTVKIRIPWIENKSGTALTCEDLAVGYPEKWVANRVNMEIDRGAHVAILGDNGQGKTTFMKTIAGELSPKEGSYRWGYGLSMGYYAQHVTEMLHPEDTIYSHLQRSAGSGVMHQDILDIAGAFLFSGDDVEKKVSVLSGGERARLCLAGLLLSKCQVLLLDEPTNHLDFETVEALGNALKTYTGTIFFISHDRTFVNLVATNIVNVKDGTIRRYPGKYEEYVYHLEMQARNLESEDVLNAEFSGGEAATGAKEREKEEREKERAREDAARKQIRSEITKLKNKITKLENRIEYATKEKDAILKEMSGNPFNYSRKRNERLKELTVRLEEDESLWLKLHSELESLNNRA